MIASLAKTRQLIVNTWFDAYRFNRELVLSFKSAIDEAVKAVPDYPFVQGLVDELNFTIKQRCGERWDVNTYVPKDLDDAERLINETIGRITREPYL
jgi:hypothetical protein